MSKDKRKAGIPVQVRLTKEQVARIDNDIKLGIAANRTEWIRSAIEERMIQLDYMEKHIQELVREIEEKQKAIDEATKILQRIRGE